MKILMLGWELPPHNSGGLGVACYQMSKALASEGVDIDFIIPYTAEHPGIDYMNIYSATPLPPNYHDLGAYNNGQRRTVKTLRMSMVFHRCAPCNVDTVNMFGSL